MQIFLNSRKIMYLILLFKKNRLNKAPFFKSKSDFWKGGVNKQDKVHIFNRYWWYCNVDVKSWKHLFAPKAWAKNLYFVRNVILLKWGQNEAGTRHTRQNTTTYITVDDIEANNTENVRQIIYHSSYRLYVVCQWLYKMQTNNYNTDTN